MAKSPEQLFDFLKSLNIAFETQEHEPLYTVGESRNVHRAMRGAHVKNLFVKDKKSRIFALVCLADAVIDLKRIHEKIGASGRVSFAGADLLAELWGVAPGSVTPFGAINDQGHRVHVVLEARLMDFERINVHPLVNTMTTGLAIGDLIRFLKATGHEPEIVAFAECGIVSH